MLDERGDEVLTRLFAVADDVDAGQFLFFQREDQGVLLAFGQLFVLQAPGRPELFGLGKPGGFGQAAGGRGGQKLFHGGCPSVFVYWWEWLAAH